MTKEDLIAAMNYFKSQDLVLDGNGFFKGIVLLEHCRVNPDNYPEIFAEHDQIWYLSLRDVNMTLTEVKELAQYGWHIDENRFSYYV